MSNQVDMEANNLCIPEDAFEKFQAVSMYEEEECIILPQKKPPPAKPLKLEEKQSSDAGKVNVSSSKKINMSRNRKQDKDIVKQPLSSSCVESSASLEESSGLIDSPGSSQRKQKEYNYDSDMVSNSDNINNQDISAEPLSSKKSVTPRKRGRKPKRIQNQTDESVVSNSKNVQNPDISSTPFSSDPEASDTSGSTSKKRGRPRKVESALDEHTETILNISDKEQPNELRSTDTNIISDDYSTTKVATRRKRNTSRSVVKTNTKCDSQEKPLSLDDKTQENKKSVQDIVPEKSKKRKRKSVVPTIEKTVEGDNIVTPDSSKILSDNISDNDDLDDIYLSKLRTIPDQSNISNITEDTDGTEMKLDTLEDTSPKNIEGQPSQPKKKRGRPKKAKPIESLSNLIEKSGFLANSSASIEGAYGTGSSLFETNTNEIVAKKVEQSVESITDSQNEQQSAISVPKEASEKQITDHMTETEEMSLDNATKVPSNNESNDSPIKRNTKMPVMADFEYNIDSVLGNGSKVEDNSLLVEDTSKRPVRRKVKKFQYEEESDEDPFANVELSDDEPRRGRRGNKYYSDDEYIPGKRGKRTVQTSTDTEISDSDLIAKSDENKKQRRKKFRKKSDNQSPRKRGKKDNEQKHVSESVKEIDESGDVEICVDSAVVKTSDGDSQNSLSQLYTNEFENFLAKKIQGTNLKIKKVSAKVPSESNKIDIPVLDPEAKKSIEMCTQTTIIPSTSVAVQTGIPYDVPLKENIPLTLEQSEKACFFLNSIVKTTSELGLLMTQKSEDFIKKKINTNHVTDTAKMDYCVKKSYLLFKLAKHNLMQMEEDLSKQYEQFLAENNLTRCREEPKSLKPTTKEANSDSDCEIVDVAPSPQTNVAKKNTAKPAFNPKTVFLNKELSIKIAKKPNENKKLDIKGRHTVWINDTVLVKKVKPTQSFLAQDSRNKKPPDNYITTKMVSDFFKSYYRQQALSVCAPFVTTDWVNVCEECVCNYFVVKPLQHSADYSNSGLSMNAVENSTTSSEQSPNITSKIKVISSPDTLFTLCFLKLKTQPCYKSSSDSEEDVMREEVTHEINCEVTDIKQVPITLFRLCVKAINETEYNSRKTTQTAVTQPCYKSSNDAEEDVMRQEVTHEIKCELTDIKQVPITLFRLCLKAINETEYNSRKTTQTTVYSITSKPESFNDENVYMTPYLQLKIETKEQIVVSPLKILCHKRIVDMILTPPLKSKYNKNENGLITAASLKALCHRKVVELLDDSSTERFLSPRENSLDMSFDSVELNESCSINSEQIVPNYLLQNDIKSLFSLSLEYIKTMFCLTESNNNDVLIPKSLKEITFENVKYLLYANDYIDNYESDTHPLIEGLLINSVNTLSEEAFLNLDQYNADIPDSTEYDDGFDNDDSFEPNVEEDVGDHTEPSWVSQVQMQELRSCAISDADVGEQPNLQPIITHIKIEPLDELTDNLLDTVPIKSEPVHAPDEMTIIPDLKTENDEHTQPSPIQRQNSNSYDVETFEQFVSSSKLMRALTGDNIEEIYSQSAARIRRQHEPDNYEENNADMLGLLVPHTYEPLSIQTAKGSLMESSSDESSKNTKITSKKPLGRRPRKKPKKSEQKQNNKESNTTGPVASSVINEPASEPVLSTASTSSPPVFTKDKEKQKVRSNEVAILTRKMKEKIRQKEKQNESSDSENENIAVRLRNRDKQVASDLVQDKTINNETKSNEIQCNNVDSTDHIDESVGTFTGFTSIETNEMSNYEKYMKFVYEKVIPTKEDDSKKKNKVLQNASATAESPDKPLIDPNETVELLECEPTLPIFDDSNVKVKKAVKTKASKSTVPQVESAIEVVKSKVAVEAPTADPYIERHGWHCYPVNSRDAKLYQETNIYLEKLPESFVQTYFQYQNIVPKDKSDKEINRLTNLNSLNRPAGLKDRKSQNSSKQEAKDGQTAQESEDESRTVSAVDSDHYDELMPSDDEPLSAAQEALPPVLKQTENSLAKNLLMNDNESDEDTNLKVKKEPIENEGECKKSKSLSKKKVIVKVEDPGDLMLTADKMMNKELTLLHAPVVMDDKLKATPSKGPVTRHSQRSGSKSSPPNAKAKMEEDSSSEEEKQWVSTKEKLLKRLGKKESASADDAKRAKLVSEFIERREINPESRKRRGVRARRSGKKFLERQKQLRVLQRELFGETSNDPTVSKRSVAAWKGRRNIRKVLDKKSLARSTVIANMEEFERKRRLNARQTRLRELLGCEEGVNVLVINDEVCLEYDFEEHRPVVTIHPFFTKVMKAHQYEGVKFMWDACFESLSDIEAGHAGGGCILAHCMGLGKTLQVLALLHTVLTHPRVGMQRVLVCCPLSTVLNWVDEIHKWIGPVTNKIKVFELSKLKKTYERAYQLEDWYNGGGIFIIGYELFRSLSTLDPLLDDVRPTIVNKIRTALLDPGPDIIVCDEGHLLKNDCSVLAVSMSRVVTKRRIVLTGTPMQNNLREYYCMVNFVKPNLLGTYAEYSNRFENPIMNGQHRDSSEEDIKLMKARTHILHKVLEGCLQRQEVSVLYPYLPKKHEYTVFITLTKCQWDLYKHYLNHYSRQMKQNSILKDFHILQKIWSHPQVLHNFQTKAQDAKAKLKLEKLEDDLATEDQEDIKEVATELWWLQYLEGGNMLDSLEVSNKFVVVFRILDECVALGDKVLIFSTSLFCLDALEYFLKKINKWSLGQEYYRLDGSVPPEVRQKWCREFNADNNVNTKLFLVSTRAGCLGLNMTSANRVIIMDTSWNPAHDIQSIFRVYRFGQKKDCFIYRLVALGTMEQKIYERSVTKQAVACRVVDEQQIDRHYNMAELTELYRYDEAGSSVCPGVAVGVRDVALLRVARETALHAVHEHDSLLRSSEQGLPEHERNAAWMQFQQEQAHKQIENKLIANIPKISLKRLQGNHYTQAIELDDIKMKTENIKNGDTSDDFVPQNDVKAKKCGKSFKIVAPPTTDPPKNKVGRPRKTPKTDNLETPSTSNTPMDSMVRKHQDEEQMVDKISQILIQHDFHLNSEHSKIAKLVANVRNIVDQGRITRKDRGDELAVSIARVLLSKEMSVPTLTGIMCESINNTHMSETNEKTPEPIPCTPPTEPNVSVANTSQSEPNNRRKRKAALAAEKHIDSIAQDVIINLDDEHSNDTEFVPDRSFKYDKPQISKQKSIKEFTPARTSDEKKKHRKSETPAVREARSSGQDIGTVTVTEVADKPASAPLPRVRAGPKTFKNKMKQKLLEQELNHTGNATEQQSSSIVLSDEGETVLGWNQDTVEATGDITSATASSAQRVEEEVPPLPLSLLTNKNFINIVAHTYLNGNPMLDADAATLAAQYSTFKALKEAEQTGKDITSGPIYDIATKVMGKDLFKRMYNESVEHKASPVEEANVTIELRQKMNEMSDREATKGTPKKLTINPVTSSSDNTHIVRTEPTGAQAGEGYVVPVGLIQTTGGIRVNEFASNECILPDDDTHIVPHELPAPPRLQPAPTLHAQPHPAPPTAVRNTTNLITISKGTIHMPATVTGGAVPPARPSSDTICLDSDEEESASPVAAPAPAPAPVPAGHPTEKPASATPTGTPVIGVRGRPGEPLILRQVGTGSATKFVLLPAGRGAPALPRLANLEKPARALPRLAPKPAASAAPEAPAEPVPSTTAPSAACLSKLKRARCKPGDIIKISESGDIEVVTVNKLRRVPAPPAPRLPPAKPKPDAPAPTISSGDDGNPEKQKTFGQKLKEFKERVRRQLDANRKLDSSAGRPAAITPAPRPRTLSISSSSGESRPSSPSDDNPLSILRNVVHIQAADDAPPAPHRAPPPAPPARDQHAHAPDKTKPAVKREAVQKKELTNFKALKEAKSSSSTSRSPASRAPSDAGPTKPPSTRISRVSDMSSSAPSTSGLKKKLNPVNNKIFHTVDLTQFAKVAVGSGPSILKTKIEAKKRVSTAEASTPKKKKTDLPTLKDFSLDDIDDIIELE